MNTHITNSSLQLSPTSTALTLPRLGNLIYQVVDYWFLKYNPLYFFSAFCVLLGIYLVSADLELDNWKGHIALAVVILIYESSLIASAALLFRNATQYRPAVFLGLLEFVFLFDPTFRVETLSGLGPIGITFNLFWVLLVPLKIQAILWSFRARTPALTLLAPTLAAIAIFSLPLLTQSSVVHLVANWWGTIFIIVAIFWHHQMTCDLSLQEAEIARMRQIVIATWSLLIGFYFYHLWNSILWIEQPTFQQVLPQFIPVGVCLAIVLRHQAAMWVLAGLSALWLIYLPYPPVAALNLGFFGIALVWHAWYTKQQQLYVLALVAFYLSVWTFGWENDQLYPPRLAWEWQLAAGIVLTWLALGLKIRLAQIVALWGVGLGVIYSLWHLRDEITRLFSSLWYGITKFLTYLWEGTMFIGHYLWTGVKYFFSAIVSLFSYLWQGITYFLTHLWDGIVFLGFAIRQGFQYLIFYLMQLIPTTSLGWGILLLITGFVALLGGVILNWKRRT